jgi:hypothetical protein
MRIRAIVNGVCFNTTSTAIKRCTVSDFNDQNTAMEIVYNQMGRSRGFGTTVTVYDNKMKPRRYDIQLDKF